MLLVSEPIIICAECRLSDPEEGDKRKKKEKEAMPLTKADIKQKRDLTVRQFRPYFRKGIILSTNLAPLKINITL